MVAKARDWVARIVVATIDPRRMSQSDSITRLFDAVRNIASADASPAKVREIFKPLSQRIDTLGHGPTPPGAGKLPDAEVLVAGCQSLLEEDRVSTLQPTVGLLRKIAARPRLAPALAAAFVDVVDVLVGWALDEGLGEAARREILRAFVDFGPLWTGFPDFTSALLLNLISDLQAVAGGGERADVLAASGCGGVLR